LLRKEDSETFKSICQKNLHLFLIVRALLSVVKTVIRIPFFGYIPNSKKRDEFLNAFLSDVEYLGQPWLLDFMLLSIFARK
jgi:hypothetical protein